MIRCRNYHLVVPPNIMYPFLKEIAMKRMSIYELACYFASENLMHQIQRFEEEDVLLAALPGVHGTHLVSLRLDHDHELLVMRASNLLTLSTERRSVVAEALLHINNTLAMGAFTLDLTD